MADFDDLDLNSQLPATNFTGSYLVALDYDAVDEGVAALRNAAGLTLARVSELAEDLVDLDSLAGADGIVFESLGVAVLSAPPEQALSALSTDRHLIVEPERFVYALTTAVAEPPTLSWDQKEATWGLQATRVVHSTATGTDVRVAVLDTGMDLAHPDFAGRTIITKSFVSGEEVQDGNGHGTHCIGTSCGPLRPVDLPDYPRYGVAHEAQIYAGKVLSNGGSGTDRGILAGIDWALQNQCRVISMSLGAYLGSAPYSKVWEQVAQRALAQGALIVAAAGNDGQPYVSHPANCPSIMAVAALDPKLVRAGFSNQGSIEDGGQIDIAAPGVDVFSSWPMTRRYNTISGTSMATPHVAGIAAQHLQVNPTATAAELWSILTRTARRLDQPALDVGSGLAQAPNPEAS